VVLSSPSGISPSSYPPSIFSEASSPPVPPTAPPPAVPPPAVFFEARDHSAGSDAEVQRIRSSGGAVECSAGGAFRVKVDAPSEVCVSL